MYSKEADTKLLGDLGFEIKLIIKTFLLPFSKVMRGHFKGNQVGKVTQVYRKRFCLYIERVQREKANGTTVPVAIHPSNVISKIKGSDSNEVSFNLFIQWFSSIGYDRKVKDG